MRPSALALVVASVGVLVVDGAVYVASHQLPYFTAVAGAGRWIVLILTGYIAARRGGRWLVAFSVPAGALLATLLEAVAGVASGVYVVHGFGPAYVLAQFMWLGIVAVVAALLGLTAHLAVERRASAT